MPDKQDLWWTISLSNAHQVTQEIAGLIVQYGMPYITDNLDDRSLIERWSSLLRKSPKGYGYKELRFLAVLACSVKAKDIMNEALDALEEQWARKDMVLDLGSFIENLREHGLDAKPVLSESALLLQRQIDEREAKKARKAPRSRLRGDGLSL